MRSSAVERLSEVRLELVAVDRFLVIARGLADDNPPVKLAIHAAADEARASAELVDHLRSLFSHQRFVEHQCCLEVGANLDSGFDTSDWQTTPYQHSSQIFASANRLSFERAARCLVAAIARIIELTDSIVLQQMIGELNSSAELCGGDSTQELQSQQPAPAIGHPNNTAILNTAGCGGGGQLEPQANRLDNVANFGELLRAFCRLAADLLDLGANLTLAFRCDQPNRKSALLLDYVSLESAVQTQQSDEGSRSSCSNEPVGPCQKQVAPLSPLNEFCAPQATTASATSTPPSMIGAERLQSSFAQNKNGPADMSLSDLHDLFAVNSVSKCCLQHQNSLPALEARRAVATQIRASICSIMCIARSTVSTPFAETLETSAEHQHQLHHQNHHQPALNSDALLQLQQQVAAAANESLAPSLPHLSAFDAICRLQSLVACYMHATNYKSFLELLDAALFEAQLAELASLSSPSYSHLNHNNQDQNQHFNRYQRHHRHSLSHSLSLSHKTASTTGAQSAPKSAPCCHSSISLNKRAILEKLLEIYNGSLIVELTERIYEFTDCATTKHESRTNILALVECIKFLMKKIVRFLYKLRRISLSYDAQLANLRLLVQQVNETCDELKLELQTVALDQSDELDSRNLQLELIDLLKHYAFVGDAPKVIALERVFYEQSLQLSDVCNMLKEVSPSSKMKIAARFLLRWFDTNSSQLLNVARCLCSNPRSTEGKTCLKAYAQVWRSFYDDFCNLARQVGYQSHASANQERASRVKALRVHLATLSCNTVGNSSSNIGSSSLTSASLGDELAPLLLSPANSLDFRRPASSQLVAQVQLHPDSRGPPIAHPSHSAPCDGFGFIHSAPARLSPAFDKAFDGCPASASAGASVSGGVGGEPPLIQLRTLPIQSAAVQMQMPLQTSTHHPPRPQPPTTKESSRGGRSSRHRRRSQAAPTSSSSATLENAQLPNATDRAMQAIVASATDKRRQARRPPPIEVRHVGDDSDTNVPSPATTVDKWAALAAEAGDEPEADAILRFAREAAHKANSMVEFTRGEGELSTTQDLFTQAELLAEGANELYKEVRCFSYKVPSGGLKKRLLCELDFIPTLVQQLQFIVKSPTVGNPATFAKVDNILREAKILIEVVEKVVAATMSCRQHYNMGSGSMRKRTCVLSPSYRGDRGFEFQDNQMSARSTYAGRLAAVGGGGGIGSEPDI